MAFATGCASLSLTLSPDITQDHMAVMHLLWICVMLMPKNALLASTSTLTFFVASDTHLDLCSGHDDYYNNAHTVDLMNRLPGASYPPVLGGGDVQPPQGVIVSGDLVDQGFVQKVGLHQWVNYTHFYGVNGEGVLRYPTFEGFGNHDGGNSTNPADNVIRQVAFMPIPHSSTPWPPAPPAPPGHGFTRCNQVPQTRIECWD